jgi:hypothetical protein
MTKPYVTPLIQKNLCLRVVVKFHCIEESAFQNHLLMFMSGELLLLFTGAQDLYTADLVLIHEVPDCR